MPLTATSYHAEMTKSAAWDLHPAGGTVMSLEIDPPFSVVYPQRPTIEETPDVIQRFGEEVVRKA